MSRISIFGLLLVLLLVFNLALGAGESRYKGSQIIRQKRQYLGYPYGMGMGMPYSYGYGYNPYMMYRPHPMYGGMPYYRPYGFWGK
ncbi:FIP (Fungus-Induced Protein) Related [Caenorhabditis elegans]|uniref:FIP (Fungus-Induced Protein) Related n=1 Tax=Caenorhabditis elegans TaxID=6239 RepID=Q4R138_CAEEL|nr:FIP (Fungus-Induced Protein) Related [Caenorhabditis elegans]CCD62736.1 FIP (Fungus-Induced Protein) Related [Caenorhabditis elegans]|eukprot:NP_001033477.2 Uncharacterized protein CELE_F14F9.8 [Caenorhabditis elegans]